MEHLSRRTTRHVDHLLVISDPTQRGIVAANRIADFRKELDIQINHAYLIINRLRGEIPPELKTGIEKIGIPLLGIIQMDPKLSDFDINGKPLIELEDDNPVYISVAEMMEQLEL